MDANDRQPGDRSYPDPLDLVDRLFPVAAVPPPAPGDRCLLDGDARTWRVVAVHGRVAVVCLAYAPSATYRRVHVDECIPALEAEAG